MEHDAMNRDGPYLFYVLDVDPVQREDHWVIYCDQLRCFDYGDTREQAIERLREGARMLFDTFTDKEGLENFLNSREIFHRFSDAGSRSVADEKPHVQTA